MQEQLRKRLEGLKSEFQLGQSQLQELERRATVLRNNLLRMSGAIQVLEEELSESNGLAAKSPEGPSMSETRAKNIDDKSADERLGAGNSGGPDLSREAKT